MPSSQDERWTDWRGGSAGMNVGWGGSAGGAAVVLVAALCSALHCSLGYFSTGATWKPSARGDCPLLWHQVKGSPTIALFSCPGLACL